MPISPKRVLIVEDDVDIAELYKLAIEAAGYKVLVVYNGEDCIKEIRDINPNIILLDLMLPKMDGIKVLEILKDDSITKEIPVVIITNVTDDNHRIKANELGAIKYIIKSKYLPRDIANTVKEIIGK